jgi:hypothetical protein
MVCKSVHRHTLKWINQPYAEFSKVYYLFFNTAQYVSDILMSIIKSSTTAVAASGLPLERGGSSAVGRGQAIRPAGTSTTNSTATTTPQR